MAESRGGKTGEQSVASQQGERKVTAVSAVNPNKTEPFGTGIFICIQKIGVHAPFLLLSPFYLGLAAAFLARLMLGGLQ